MSWHRFKWIIARLNWLQVLIVAALLCISVAFIYSAGYRGEGVGPSAKLYQRQMWWAVLGFGVMLGVAAADYRVWKLLAGAVYGFCLFLLIWVLVAGERRYGATRWLLLFGVQFQPSELTKVSIILFLARFLSDPAHDPNDPRTLLSSLLIVGLPTILIVKQPDLGTAAVIWLIAIGLFFVAGIPLRYLVALAVVALALAPVMWFFLADYQKDRILEFLDPNRDPLGAGWNKIQSVLAIGSGGLKGKGFMKGTQNILGFLPRTIAPTDFLFSVIAEEWGFRGSSLVIGLYLGLIGTCWSAAYVARDRFALLAVAGIVLLIFIHGFVNLMMAVGLLPITGLPLPLLSYGGTFTLTVMFGLGLIQSVYVRRAGS